jgi:hypothetical protein
LEQPWGEKQIDLNAESVGYLLANAFSVGTITALGPRVGTTLGNK